MTRAHPLEAERTIRAQLYACGSCDESRSLACMYDLDHVGRHAWETEEQYRRRNARELQDARERELKKITGELRIMTLTEAHEALAAKG